jgi:alpha-galactosidase
MNLHYTTKMTTFKLAMAAALLFTSATASPQAQQFHRRQVGGEEPDVVIPGASSYNGLNLVPQMGWNNWNAFHCDVNESLLLTTAQDMIDYGLRDLGYNHIILDDCWSVGRNETGFLMEDSKQPCKHRSNQTY